MNSRLLFVCLVFAATFVTSSTSAAANSVSPNTIVLVSGVIGSGTNDNVPAGAFTFNTDVAHHGMASKSAGWTAYFLRSGEYVGLVLDGNVLMFLSRLTGVTPINQALTPPMFSTMSEAASAFSFSRMGGTFGGASTFH